MTAVDDGIADLAPFSRIVELAGIPVLFEASDSARADAVLAVTGSLQSHAGPSRLRVTFGRHAPFLPSRPFDLADGDVRAWWEEDVLFLGQGDGLIGAHVQSTDVHIGGEGDLARGFRQILPYAITHLLVRHSLFVLHGGAIQDQGRAVLVLGGSGSGKSTVVVSALRLGWRVLSDDLVVVRLGSLGPEVSGIARPIAAPSDVVRWSGLSSRPLNGDFRGRMQVLETDWDRGWHPVRATLVVTHGDSRNSELGVLTSHQLVESLILSFLAAREQGGLRVFLPVAAALACAGGRELHMSQDPEIRLTQVEAALTQVLQL